MRRGNAIYLVPFFSLSLSLSISCSFSLSTLATMPRSLFDLPGADTTAFPSFFLFTARTCYAVTSK